MSNKLNLPELDFEIEDTSTILSNMLTDLKEMFNISLTPSDPYYTFFSAIAYIFAVQIAKIVYLSKQNFLSLMSGSRLDAWGENNNCTRLGAIPASTELKFTLSEELDEDLTIPSGTRVQTSNGVTFATTEDLVISAGDTTGFIYSECVESGIIGNGYTQGQINYIMNPIASVETTVANTTISSGGFEIESDDDYRLRIHNAWDSSSTAGSMASYNYWTKSISNTIIDVLSYTPSAGFVNVAVLTKDGAVGVDSELYQRLNSLIGNSNSDKRPMTDNVTIEQPQAVDYEIDFTYYIYSTDSVQQDTIKTAVYKAVDDYISWQRNKLGRGIDPSELIKLVKNSGAKRVEVRKPATYQRLANKQWARQVGNINIVEGGYTQ